MRTTGGPLACIVIALAIVPAGTALPGEEPATFKHVVCFFDDGVGEMVCGEGLDPPKLAIRQAALYENSFYSGSTWEIWGTAADCQNVDFDLNSGPLSFFNNKISSIRVDDPTCRIAGWDLAPFFGRFMRCFPWTLGTAHEDIGTFTIDCTDLHLLPPVWGDIISAVRIENV